MKSETKIHHPEQKKRQNQNSNLQNILQKMFEIFQTAFMKKIFNKIGFQKLNAKT